MKHVCRTCRFWKSCHRPYGKGVWVMECTNPKSKNYETVPSSYGKCDGWKICY